MVDTGAGMSSEAATSSSSAMGGLGGWGDPFARDPERVLRDVMEEKISVAYARREYGVVIDERTWTVVPEETARLRAAAQTAR